MNAPRIQSLCLLVMWHGKWQQFKAIWLLSALVIVSLFASLGRNKLESHPRKRVKRVGDRDGDVGVVEVGDKVQRQHFFFGCIFFRPAFFWESRSE